MGKHKQSVDAQVLSRIAAHGMGWVFTPSDFADLGSRTAVATALKRYKACGKVRQLGRGIYDVPRRHAKLGLLWPSPEAIVTAVRNRDSVRVQPTGAYAANLLGLSEQVPAKIFYLTDGPARTIKMGNTTINFKRTTPRNMVTSDRVSGLVIQALRWLGPENVNDRTVNALRKKFDQTSKKQMLDDIRHAPAWIAATMRRIAQ